jgi:hypothetical protein
MGFSDRYAVGNNCFIDKTLDPTRPQSMYILMKRLLEANTSLRIQGIFRIEEPHPAAGELEIWIIKDSLVGGFYSAIVPEPDRSLSDFLKDQFERDVTGKVISELFIRHYAVYNASRAQFGELVNIYQSRGDFPIASETGLFTRIMNYLEQARMG